MHVHDEDQLNMNVAILTSGDWHINRNYFQHE